MKKLNRKGFTLVELLAVIIILAIVVGITIPAVLTTTNNAKKKAMKTAADTAADWVDRQYQVYATGLNGSGIVKLDSNFTDANNCKSDISDCTAESGKQVNASFITAAGLKSSNISKMTVYISTSTGRSCVKIETAAATNGDYPNSATACGGICTSSQCTSSGV